MISLDFLGVLVYNAAMLKCEICFFSGNRIYQAYTNIRAPELLIILDTTLFVRVYFWKMLVNA